MGEKACILVVDDNPDNLQVVSSFLKEGGYKIALALDGKSAFNILENIEVDLILLDIMMPEMSGFEMCQIIKGNPKTKSIPIIFITAVTEISDIVEAFKLGGVDYITKPIRGKEMLARINTHLTISALQQQLATANTNLEQMVDLRTLQLRKANEELYGKVAELKEANELLEQSMIERKHLQQEMLLAIIQSEENERTRFSQELHDGLGPILTTIKLYLQWLAKPDAIQEKGELLNQTIAIADEAIISVKEVSNNLSPHVLAKYGLSTAIESFINKVCQTENIHFSINVLLPYRLKHDIEILLYRVIIECINNTIKYSGARNSAVSIKMGNDMLIVTYTDDGKGFDLAEVKARKTGLGLVNMQNRVETLNGSFALSSSIGQGMELRIEFPYTFCKL